MQHGSISVHHLYFPSLLYILHIHLHSISISRQRGLQFADCFLSLFLLALEATKQYPLSLSLKSFFIQRLYYCTLGLSVYTPFGSYHCPLQPHFSSEMMHRCSSNSQGNMVGGPCSCGGLFHGQNNSFSMMFSMAANQTCYDETDMMYPFASSSSSVDCTLSLGTPSTRLVEDDGYKRSSRRESRSGGGGGSCMSNLCWDLVRNKNTTKAGRNIDNSNSSGNDPLLARRCANCDTTSTPLWRNGPRGPKVYIYIYIDIYIHIHILSCLH